MLHTKQIVVFVTIITVVVFFIEDYYIRHDMSELTITTKKTWVRKFDEGIHIYKLEN